MYYILFTIILYYGSFHSDITINLNNLNNWKTKFHLSFVINYCYPVFLSQTNQCYSHESHLALLKKVYCFNMQCTKMKYYVGQ